MAAAADGRSDDAFHDYSLALDRDPDFTAAWLNRGILAFKADRHVEAIADLRKALRTPADSRTLGRIHYNLALVQLASGDRESALRQRRRRDRHGRS